MVKKICVTLIAVLFVGTAAFAEYAKLTHLAKSKEPVKVYVGDFTNEVGEKLSIELFRSELEKAFTNRKSTTFVIVKDPAASTIQVTGIVKKYQYMDRGPFKPNPGIGTMALDMAATASHNYVEIETTFTITDTATKSVVWQDSVATYVKKNMTEEQAKIRIMDRVDRDFIAKAFGKGK